MLEQISANVKSRGTMPTAVFTIRQWFCSSNVTFVICFPLIVLPTGLIYQTSRLINTHSWLINNRRLYCDSLHTCGSGHRRSQVQEIVTEIKHWVGGPTNWSMQQYMFINRLTLVSDIFIPANKSS